MTKVKAIMMWLHEQSYKANQAVVRG